MKSANIVNLSVTDTFKMPRISKATKDPISVRFNDDTGNLEFLNKSNVWQKRADTTMQADIETRTTLAEATKAAQDTLNSGVITGRVNLSVFNGGCTNSYSGTTKRVSGPYGDIKSTSTDLTGGGKAYLHFKFDPIKYNSHQMISIYLYGQEYGYGSKNINVSGSCYSYGHSAYYTKMHSQNFSANSHEAIFYKSPTKTGTYLRITIHSAYYLSVGMDSYTTRQGNKVIKGQITPFFSKKEFL